MPWLRQKAINILCALVYFWLESLILSINITFHNNYLFFSRKTQKRSNPKKTKSSGGGGVGSSLSTPKLPSEAALVFKTYDKSSGASLRSSKIKFPLTLGQKKTKTIEQVLEELSVGEFNLCFYRIKDCCLVFTKQFNNINRKIISICLHWCNDE